MHKLEITFKIIDVETSELLTIKTYSAKSESTKLKDNGDPLPIDSESLFSESLQKITKKFIKHISPHKAKLSLVFEVEMEMSEIYNAIECLRKGNTQNAISILQTTLEKPNMDTITQAKIIYNIGIAEVMNGIYEIAMSKFERAIKLNPENGLYPKAVKLVAKEIQAAQKLAEQNVHTE